jgi:hypothetical protein
MQNSAYDASGPGRELRQHLVNPDPAGYFRQLCRIHLTLLFPQLRLDLIRFLAIKALKLAVNLCHMPKSGSPISRDHIEPSCVFCFAAERTEVPNSALHNTACKILTAAPRTIANPKESGEFPHLCEGIFRELRIFWEPTSRALLTNVIGRFGIQPIFLKIGPTLGKVAHFSSASSRFFLYSFTPPAKRSLYP